MDVVVMDNGVWIAIGIGIFANALVYQFSYSTKEETKERKYTEENNPRLLS
jgi:hypothetical protein